MATENELEIVIRAVDQATQELQKIQGIVRSFGTEGQISGRKVQEEMKKQGDAMKVTGQKANDLQREWGKLTSSTGFFTEGLQSVRRMINSLTWGTIIGAVSALTMQMIQSLLTMRDFNAEMKSASDNFMSLAGNINPALQKTEAFRQAQFEVSVAEFAVARATAARGIVEAQTNLVRLESISIIDRLKFAMLSITDAALGEGLAQKHLGETILRNAQQHSLLQKSIEFMKLVLDTNIPTWEEYKRLTEEISVKTIPEWLIGTENVNQGLNEQIRLLRMIIDLEEQLSGNPPKPIITTPEELEQQKAAAAAVAEWEIRMNDLRLKSYADTAGAIKNITEAIYIFSGQRSKALFQIVKVASIAEAIANTYRAANQVLADPTLPYFAKAAAVAATITAGLANVARISATNIGSGAGGGGGGIGGASGGGTPVSRGSLRGPEQGGQPMQVTVQVNALDPASVNWDRISQNIADSLGRHLERGGSAGPVQISFERN